MRNTGVALTMAMLAGLIATAGARAGGNPEVLIRVSVPGADAVLEDAGPEGGGRLGLTLVPDPLVIVRDRADGATWRLDAAAQGLGSVVEIRFEGDTPFTAAAASGRASAAISLDGLRDPVVLGSFPYAVRLLDREGVVVATGNGRVEVEEPAGIPRLAILIACAVGVVFLISNYVERRPLTRSYEEETGH